MSKKVSKDKKHNPVISALVPDWQEKAAAQSATPAEISEDTDAQELEKSFMDQAYARCSNAVPPLFQSSYRVGWEIVSKNSDNSRLCGVFIFRVKKVILMAPIFFSNGTLSGEILLYRHDAKRFVPATPEWAEFIIGNAGVGEGEGVPMSMRQQAHDQMHLERLAVPPASFVSGSAAGMYRSASYREPWAWTSTPESKAALAEALPDFTRAYETLVKSASPDSNSILRQFITEDGSWNAIKKIANTAKVDFKFANALFCASDEANYMPDLPYLAKQASTPSEEPALTLHLRILDNPGVKSASPDDLAKGYSMTDKRPAESTNDVIYADAEKELQSIGEPGIYDVLLSDGATHEMLCALTESTDFVENTGYPAPPAVYPNGSGHIEVGPAISIVDLSDKQSLSSRKGVLGTFTKSVPEDIGDAVPETGKAYRLYCAESKTLSGPFLVEKIDTDKLGLKRVYVRNHGNECKSPMVLNPDYASCDINDKIIGKCCRFIEIAFEKEDCDWAPDKKAIKFKDQINLGNKYAMDQFIFQNGYKKASVRRSGDNYLFKAVPNARYVGEMSKLGCKCYLMGACALTERAADDVLDILDTKPKGEMNFLWQEKKAYNQRFTDFPVFPESMNEEFGVNEQPASDRYIVQSQRDIPVLPKQRIGDRYSQETQDTIDQMQPMELYAMSKERGMPNLFEHGMVGSLVNTYDSAALIEKYLPALEDGLDRIGRILFLFYWKPEDFVKAFGSDDQDQLENKLVSNFKSFGALILELMQKNQQRQSGSTGLS